MSAKKKVVIAISGGVDSSVSAFLLKKQGFEVIGVFMRLGANQERDEMAARLVCQKLKIKFYPFNLFYKFKQEIIKYFIDSYKEGLTPNPCVKCNKIIKFGELLHVADELGADYLATGHYIRRMEDEDKSIYRLYRSEDHTKDQSYFLYNLNQKQLAKILFPLGNLGKERVKKIAAEENLPYLEKESQDICFLKKDREAVDHNYFLKENIAVKRGAIKTLEGKKIGEHQGLHFYTIGQRKGVEIGGIGPFYVAKKDHKSNTLYVAKNNNDPALFKRDLIAEEVNWISGEEPDFPFKSEAVIRYRHKSVKCEIKKMRNEKTKKYKVNFTEPQRAVTAGQSIVFYKDDELLGGGIIKI